MLRSAMVALAAWSMAGAAFAGDVHVTLRGVEARPGKLLATLQTQAQFMQGRGAYNLALDPANGTVTFTFDHVAPGDYVLSVMHDEDGDYHMKRSATGAIEEGWAFSNGGQLAGAPTFDVLKFSVGASDVSIATEMFYPYVAPPGQ